MTYNSSFYWKWITPKSRHWKQYTPAIFGLHLLKTEFDRGKWKISHIHFSLITFHHSLFVFFFHIVRELEIGNSQRKVNHEKYSARYSLKYKWAVNNVMMLLLDIFMHDLFLFIKPFYTFASMHLYIYFCIQFIFNIKPIRWAMSIMWKKIPSIKHVRFKWIH